LFLDFYVSDPSKEINIVAVKKKKTLLNVQIEKFFDVKKLTGHSDANNNRCVTVYFTFLQHASTIEEITSWPADVTAVVLGHKNLQ
jgi:hypothetical protein